MAIVGDNENAYSEYRDSTDPNMTPAIGLGGTVQRPVSAIVGNPIGTSDILIYEFGHAIKSLGVANAEELIREYETAYIYVKQSGLWADSTYAISNPEECFACMSAIWFETGSDGIQVNTREEMKIYDPKTYSFLKSSTPANALTCRTDLDSMVRIGFDSYKIWKFKGVSYVIENRQVMGADNTAATENWKHVYSIAYNQYMKANVDEKDVTLASDKAEASVWTVLEMGEGRQAVCDTGSILCLYPVGTTDGDPIALTELEASNSAIYWKVVELQ